jgi:YidC/Oxa1 family membrane protein insertase
MGTDAPYYAEQGWLADNVKTPNGDSVWQADGKDLTPTTPVTLKWNNGEGVTFVKTISVDENYLFNVKQRVENKTGHAITLYPYARIMRLHRADDAPTKPVDRSSAMVMQGMLGVFGTEYHSAKYDALSKHPDAPEEAQSYSATGGWFGITDKYWFTALVPDQQKTVDARFVRTGIAPLVGMWPFRHIEHETRDFQTDYRGQAVTVAAGSSAKEMDILDSYEKNPGIPRFDLAVDFGWFYVITKPFFYLLTWIGQQVGNFGVAIILFTLLVRGAMFPVAAASYKSMQKMKVAGPKMKELQAKYKDDPAKLQGEMMAFYRKEKINPMAGCLPMLIQIPVFLSLYKVLYVTLEMRQAPFFGFLTDLSVADPTNIVNLFGLLPFNPPAALHLGLLPILMGITSWLQIRSQPTPMSDATQKQMFGLMPWMMMFLLAGLPTGLLLYWISSNILGSLQQWWIQKSIAKA